MHTQKKYIFIWKWARLASCSQLDKVRVSNKFQKSWNRLGHKGTENVKYIIMSGGHHGTNYSCLKIKALESNGHKHNNEKIKSGGQISKFRLIRLPQ